MAQLSRVRMLLLRLAVGLATAALGSLAVAVGLVSRRGAVRVAHLWARLCLWFAGIGVSVEGADRIEPARRYVIMANHESPLDIPVLLVALPASLELRFLAKRSLFGVPFLGWSMRAMGFIPVDREDRSTAAAMLARTLEQVRRGGSPLVFPEQTWTLDGRLLPFQRGGFVVALKSGLPILPVGLEGPRRALPPEGRALEPRTVTVRIGEAVETAGLRVSARAELSARVRREIDRLRGPEGHVPDGTGNEAGADR